MGGERDENLDIARWVLTGAAVAGALGAIGGLAIGLLAYAPTAWFAVLELGVPCAIVGAVAGAIAAGLATAHRRVRR